MHRRRILALAVLGGVCLTGCATSSGGNAAGSFAERADGTGIDPDLVYIIEVDGYDLAPQSVNADDGGGLRATWFNADPAAMVTVQTKPGGLTDDSCESEPLWNLPEQPVTCDLEGEIWHRSGGGVDEYVAVRDHALVWVRGDGGAPQEDLLTAAQSVRLPSDAEFELLLSDVPQIAGTPVERGDIPENGDGAPVNPTGPGG